MYPLDVLTNAPRPVALAGRSYPVRQLTLAEWGGLQAWLKSVAPSPLTLAVKALAEAGPVAQPVQDALFRQAQEESRRWPPKVGTLAWLRAIDDLEGGLAKFVQAALSAGGTHVSDLEASAIADLATRDEIGQLMTACLIGEPSPPKAEGEATPPSPTTGDGSTTGS